MLSRKHQKLVQSKPVKYSPEYVYTLDSLSPSRILSSLSDRTLRVLDVGSGSSVAEVAKISAHSANISGVAVVDSNVVLSASQDGLVKQWDLRTNTATTVLKHSSSSPLLSIDYSGLTNTVAAGTELVGQDAGVVVWDVRNPRSCVREYMDSHNDDVTCVAFHATTAHALLSGATDGLVTRYDTSIADEDDAVMQVINHGASIHRTGFFDNDSIYALSHIETFSVYKQTDKDDETEQDDPDSTRALGDVREAWGCEYVIDIGQSYAAVGNNSESTLALIPMKSGSFDLQHKLQLAEAHGQEVVRCVLLDERNSRVFSGGEDGQICVWQTEGHVHADSAEWSDVSRKKNKKSHKESRFKPY